MNNAPSSNDAACKPIRAKRRRELRPWHAATIWCLFLSPLLTWGTPSNRLDGFLFGGEPAWPAERYGAARALRELRERNAGADTDLDPVADRTQILNLTADEAHRGEILLRYRLYSNQPDEMITFRALQRMKPRALDLDPRMYQYGGDYVYMVGAALGASSIVGLTQLTGDLNTYLDQPELFGRFYVVARAISLLFGGVALIAVFRLAARVGGRFGGWSAMLLVATSPVFLSGALEAKPHLPAAAMALWTVEYALRWRAGQKRGDATKVGLFSGYALALILTGAAAVLTAAAAGIDGFARRRERQAPGLGEWAWIVALAAGVYAILSPYVFINLLTNRAALFSNLGNSTAMYSVARIGDGATRVGALMVESLGWLTLATGVVGFLWLLIRNTRATIIAAAGGLGMLALCVAIGAGKPPEFARFLVLPAALLGVSAGIAITRLARHGRLFQCVIVLACIALAGGDRYVRSFVRESVRGLDSRSQAALWLSKNAHAGDAFAVVQEPAPYCVPALHFANQSVALLPSNPPAGIQPGDLPGWLVFADDNLLEAGPWGLWSRYYEFAWGDSAAMDGRGSPITWANKPIWIYRRKAE